MNPPRNRLVYGAAVLGVIALGLASRETHLRAIFGTSPGDALWASMVYLGLGVLMPRISSGRLAVVSLIAAYGIEFSQLIQTPWLLAIRETTTGHLVLGSTFYWPDLIAYTIGVVLAFLVEIRVFRSKRPVF
jgi:hypothetical protein